MTTNQFWDLIERSRRAGDECEAQAEALAALLRRLPAPEVVAFDRELAARLAEAYRWDLCGVAYLVNGGCSDDGFVYFRLWLAGQGRAYFEAALRDPERAADRATPDEAECEALLYAASDAHVAVTGEDLPRTDGIDPGEPTGEPWPEEDLADRVPAVAARFG